MRSREQYVGGCPTLDQPTRWGTIARKRLIETDYPDGKSVKNTYDGPGNLAGVTDQASNVVDYTYDAANQLKTVKQVNHPDPANNTNSYGYDSLGNLTGLSDENQHITLNGFNLLNEPVLKTLPDTTHTETRNYDAAGNLQSLLHFNGVTTSYTYEGGWPTLDLSTRWGCPILSTVSSWKGWKTTNLPAPALPSTLFVVP